MQWCVRFSCDVFSEEEKENCVGGDSKESKMQVVKIAFEMTCANNPRALHLLRDSHNPVLSPFGHLQSKRIFLQYS